MDGTAPEGDVQAHGAPACCATKTFTFYSNCSEISFVGSLALNAKDAILHYFAKQSSVASLEEVS